MRLADDLERIAAGMAALRVVHGLMKGRDMTIEIKGLGANVEAARAAIRRARDATSRMNESGRTLERTANEIASVFEQHTKDLMIEANNLGNGSGESETQSETVVVKSSEVGEVKAVLGATVTPRSFDAGGR